MGHGPAQRTRRLGGEPATRLCGLAGEATRQGCEREVAGGGGGVGRLTVLWSWRIWWWLERLGAVAVEFRAATRTAARRPDG